jgi:hypothetical protein
VRVALVIALVLGLVALVANAADDTPTPAEEKAIAAARLLGGKAAIDQTLPADARVSVKLDSVTDAGLAALAKQPAVGAIQAFDGRRCTEKGFAALKGLPHLRRLTLNQSGVSDKELALIAACPELRVLVIPESTVTDAGLAALAKLDRLEELNLADAVKVTDKGMATIKTLERLQVLHLDKTGLTDKGLAELKPLDGLRRLSVAGTKVTDKAADTFPDEMPNLRAVRR